MSESIISIENVSFTYGGPLALENINLCIEKGEFIGVVGPNGGGKSTLLKIILGLLKPSHGKVTVCGRTPQKGRLSIGYVPQQTMHSRHCTSSSCPNSSRRSNRLPRRRISTNHTTTQRNHGPVHAILNSLRHRQLNSILWIERTTLPQTLIIQVKEFALQAFLNT